MRAKKFSVVGAQEAKERDLVRRVRAQAEGSQVKSESVDLYGRPCRTAEDSRSDLSVSREEHREISEDFAAKVQTRVHGGLTRNVVEDMQRSGWI